MKKTRRNNAQKKIHISTVILCFFVTSVVGSVLVMAGNGMIEHPCAGDRRDRGGLDFKDSLPEGYRARARSVRLGVFIRGEIPFWSDKKSDRIRARYFFKCLEYG